VPSGTKFNVINDGNGGWAEVVACFAAGTRIATESGEVAVELLSTRDLLRLADSGTAVIQWIGRRRVDCRRHSRQDEVQPVRVIAHAFGFDRPARDLWLSPDHAVFVENALVPIRYLLNGATVRQEDVDSVTYWHIELPGHGVLLTEGLPCESYLDTGNRVALTEGGMRPEVHCQSHAVSIPTEASR
jgi:hypothetical protein